MAYSTVEMVRMALVPSSDGSKPNPPSNTAADLEDVQLQDAISEADAMIDSYIGKYYTVPVAAVPVPHPVDYWSRNIAAYNATLAYRESQDFDDTDPVARRYNATMAALKDVGAGRATLTLPTNVGVNAGTGAGAPFNPYIGDLFDPGDFNLRPMPPDWPNGGPYCGRW